MPVSSGNTNTVQQNNAAAHNGSRNGIAFKSPVQQKQAGGEEELTEQPVSSYASGNQRDVPPFNPSVVPIQRQQNLFGKPGRLPVQLKTGEMGHNTVPAAAIVPAMPVAQLVKLSNGTDTDKYSFKQLEEMVNSGKLNDGDIALVEKVMDAMKGGAPPASVMYNKGGEEVPDDDYSDHEFFDFNNIPVRAFQEHVVNHSFYRFWNDAERCVEFTDPKNKVMPDGKTRDATPVQVYDVVDIKGPNGKIRGIPAQNLKQPPRKNYYHFKAANMLRDGTTLGTSPAGKTWHHHRTEGRMELLDRDVHAAFKHAGGKKYWGTV